MTDPKSTRPTRDALGEAMEMAAKNEYHPDVARLLLRELLVLQHGMEELERKWREKSEESMAQATAFTRGACYGLKVNADELQKLREGT